MMISAWKRQLLERAAELFDMNHKSLYQMEGQVDELYRRIGQLKVENGSSAAVPWRGISGGRAAGSTASASSG
jgi:hypothetical protein